MKFPLTIAMLTYDDFHGVVMTIQALRMYHPEVLSKVQILVIDNKKPLQTLEEPFELNKRNHGSLVRSLLHSVPNSKLVHYHKTTGTSLKSLLFEHADGLAVMVTDCHCMFTPGSIAKLVKFYERNPDFDGLLQGPILNDRLDIMATHCEPHWRGSMFGTWAIDRDLIAEDAPPKEIPLHGMGCFVCLRSAYRGVPTSIRGFCIEEGFVHEKLRLSGLNVWSAPFLKWWHRFGRPEGNPYPHNLNDKIRAAYAMSMHVSLSTDIITEYFSWQKSEAALYRLKVEAENLKLPTLPRSSPPFLGKPIRIIREKGEKPSPKSDLES